jgi:hypothetical protein
VANEIVNDNKDGFDTLNGYVPISDKGPSKAIQRIVVEELNQRNLRSDDSLILDLLDKEKSKELFGLGPFLSVQPKPKKNFFADNIKVKTQDKEFYVASQWTATQKDKVFNWIFQNVSGDANNQNLDLARKIYKKHRANIDLILSNSDLYGSTKISGQGEVYLALYAALDELLQKYGHLPKIIVGTGGATYLSTETIYAGNQKLRKVSIQADFTAPDGTEVVRFIDTNLKINAVENRIKLLKNSFKNPMKR